MKVTDISGKRILYPLFFIVLTGIILFNIIRIVSPSDPYQVKVFRVKDGWGYQIVHDHNVFINQPFIPAFSGKIPFPSRRSAMRTGKLVLDRLRHQKSPTLDQEDLRKLGIDTSIIRKQF